MYRALTCSASAAAYRIRLLTNASSISRRAVRMFLSCSQTCSRKCGIESDRSHGGILTILTAIICRRIDRKARSLAAVIHKKDIGMLGTGKTSRSSAPGLYTAAMRKSEGPPRFPMPRCASSEQRPAIRADGGDARWLTFLQAMRNIAV